MHTRWGNAIHGVRRYVQTMIRKSLTILEGMAPMRVRRHMAQYQKVVATMFRAVLGQRENPSNWCLLWREGDDKTEWLWGRNGSPCTPSETCADLFPCCSQLCSASEHFVAYVRAWQQELIALSVLSARRIAVCVLWWLSGLHVSEWGDG